MTPLTTMRDAAPESSYPSAHPTTAAAAATAGMEERSGFVHGFNDVGGRPDERRGTRGSFTPGVRIMSGGPPRDAPLDEETTNHGTVLFVSSIHKPDKSGEARTNVGGGRPTERLGGNSGRRFTPEGSKTFLGGVPRDVPLQAGIANRGKVLFVSSIHKPDLSGEARTNAVRPAERLGSQGRFTPGVRIMSGGRRRRPRDVVNPSEVDVTAVNRGRALFVSSVHKPVLSYLPAFNVAGGRPDERFGTEGSFTRGVRIISGGEAHDVPVETDAPNNSPGTVLFVSSVHKPDLCGEARTNIAGGRPSERLGGHPGRFTPGVRRWRGGEPRDVPAERETTDHGIVLFPRTPSQVQVQAQQRFMSPPSFVTGSSAAGGGTGNVNNNNIDNSDNSGSSDGWFDVETEEITMEEAYQAQDADLAHQATKTTMNRTTISSSCSDLTKGADRGMLRRCGSDSQFKAQKAPFFSWTDRPSFR